MIKIKIWNYENARNEGEINNGCFTTLVPYKILLLLFCVKFEFHVVKHEIKRKEIWISKKKKGLKLPNWSKV